MLQALEWLTYPKMIGVMDMAQLEKTILVIDDDLDFQLMVSIMLENVGFSVKYLVEGRLSLALHTAKTCDMILLDVELPGMNGIELSKQLKSNPEIEAIPIILVTGHSDCDQLFSESKADALFKKPFSLSALLLKITELLTPVYFRSPTGVKEPR
jgi:CheY-like chemotaxis protein